MSDAIAVMIRKQVKRNIVKHVIKTAFLLAQASIYLKTMWLRRVGGRFMSCDARRKKGHVSKAVAAAAERILMYVYRQCSRKPSLFC